MFWGKTRLNIFLICLHEISLDWCFRNFHRSQILLISIMQSLTVWFVLTNGLSADIWQTDRWNIQAFGWLSSPLPVTLKQHRLTDPHLPETLKAQPGFLFGVQSRCLNWHHRNTWVSSPKYRLAFLTLNHSGVNDCCLQNWMLGQVF